MLKRILLAIVLSIASCGVYAYDFSAVAPTGQTLYYQTMSGFKAKVTYPYTSSNNWGGYTKPSGDLTVPDSVTYSGHTYMVTSIDNYAFYGCDNLTSITIPAT